MTYLLDNHNNLDSVKTVQTEVFCEVGGRGKLRAKPYKQAEVYAVTTGF